MASTLTITMDLGNDAFAENCGAEVARILRGLADRLEPIVDPKVAGEIGLFDANGNRVGTANAFDHE